MSDIEVVDRRAEMVRAMPLESLTKAKHGVAEQLADCKHMLEAINAEIIRRAAEKNATVLFTEEDEIKVERKQEIQHRVDVLRTLKGVIPDEVFNKAVYLEQPEPFWKCDTVKLKSIAKKYGDEAAAIVEKGMPREFVGTPKVTITPRNLPLNVTETAEALA